MSAIVDQTLTELETRYKADFAAAHTADELRLARAALLGKGGLLSQVLTFFRDVEPAGRAAYGQRINAAADAIDAAYHARLAELTASNGLPDVRLRH